MDAVQARQRGRFRDVIEGRALLETIVPGGKDPCMEKTRKMKEYQKVLCIAGSECLGCSGVQADLKAISACGAFGAGALTCLVNMSTTKVKEIMPLPEEFVASSIRSFLDDVKADAIKTGMLFTKPVIDKVGSTLLDYPEVPKVVDPVMVAATGDRLIELEAIEAYKEPAFCWDMSSARKTCRRTWTAFAVGETPPS